MRGAGRALLAGALAGALALGGCGSKPPREPAAPIDSEQLNAIASSGPTVAETLAQGDDRTAAQPVPALIDYAGRWAATPALCGTAWAFAPTRVTLPDASCVVLKREARTTSETKLTLDCTAAGLTTNETWSLVKRDDGSMIVARTAGNAVPQSATLRRCA